MKGIQNTFSTYPTPNPCVEVCVSRLDPEIQKAKNVLSSSTHSNFRFKLIFHNDVNPVVKYNSEL